MDGPIDDEQLKIYAEEVKQRIDQEKEKTEEDKFLRSSLRGSDRLKAIENYRRIIKQSECIHSELNEAFEFDEQETPSSFELSELISYLRTKVHTLDTGNVEDANEADQWEWLLRVLTDPILSKSFLMHDHVAKAYETCKQIMHPKPRHLWPVLPGSAYDVLEAVQGQILDLLCQSLPSDASTINLMSVLHNVLSRPRLGNLMLAMDGLANTWLFEVGREEEESPDEQLDENDQVDPSIEETAVPGCYAKLAYDENGRDSFSEQGIRLKYVVFQKGDNEFLGATVCIERRSVLIARIVNGGLAQKTGLLHEGDELLAANGIELLGKDLNTVTEILSSVCGQLVLLVAPADRSSQKASVNGIIHLRALFSYCPEEDSHLVCRDLGLSFTKGDIIHVTDRRDPDWWQAYRSDEDNGITGAFGTLAGLVPSPIYQRRRAILRLQSWFNNSPDDIEWEDEPSDLESNEKQTLHDDASVSKSKMFRGMKFAFTKRKGTKSQSSQSVAEIRNNDQTNDEMELPDSTNYLINSALVSSVYGDTNTTGRRRSNVHSEDVIEEWSAAGPVWGQHGYEIHSLRRPLGSRGKPRRRTSSSCLRRIRGEKQSRFSRARFPTLDPVPDPSLATAPDPVDWLNKEVARGYLEHPTLWTYEPVIQYFPQPLRRRPLVFVGPAHTGRHQLMQRLIRSDTNRFCPAPIYTTNQKKKADDSTPYICVTEEAFETDRKRGEFIEWGVFDRCRYGTSRSTIRDLVENGKVCCISLRPESLRIIRNSGLKPYVIFISPPERADEFRRIQKQLGLKVECTDLELIACIEASRKMEFRFGQWFDIAIVPETMDSTVEELNAVATRLEREPSWIPRYWV